MNHVIAFPDSGEDEEQQQPFTMEEDEEEVETHHLSHRTPNAITSEIDQDTSEQQGRRSIRISFPVLIAAFAILSLLNFASFYQRHEARNLSHDSITQERIFVRIPVQLSPQMVSELDIEDGGQEVKQLLYMYPKCDSPFLSQIGNQICNLELNVPECNFDEGDCQQVSEN